MWILSLVHTFVLILQTFNPIMREIVHIQAGQCGNQIGAKFWETIRLDIGHINHWILIVFIIK